MNENGSQVDRRFKCDRFTLCRPWIQLKENLYCIVKSSGPQQELWGLSFPNYSEGQ